MSLNMTMIIVVALKDEAVHQEQVVAEEHREAVRDPVPEVTAGIVVQAEAAMREATVAERAGRIQDGAEDNQLHLPVATMAVNPARLQEENLPEGQEEAVDNHTKNRVGPYSLSFFHFKLK